MTEPTNLLSIRQELARKSSEWLLPQRSVSLSPLTDPITSHRPDPPLGYGVVDEGLAESLPGYHHIRKIIYLRESYLDAWERPRRYEMATPKPDDGPTTDGRDAYLEVATSERVIYDLKNPEAWIQSDLWFPLDTMR